VTVLYEWVYMVYNNGGKLTVRGSIGETTTENMTAKKATREKVTVGKVGSC